MSIKDLRDAMNLAKRIRDVKEQEYLLAKAQYDLRMAEIELEKKICDMEKTNNGE